MKTTNTVHPGVVSLFVAALLLLDAVTAGQALAISPFGPQVAKGLDWYQKFDETAAKAKDVNTDEGGAWDPDYDPPGMPDVPISCQKNQDCYRCYEVANQKIKDLRISFEKLRIVYKETDEYTKAAVAFGDGVAGSTGVAALEWNHQREKIKGSFKHFEFKYREAFNKLITKLKSALQDVALCEKQYYGQEDWYARFGYMFHSFIAMHYMK